MDLTQRIHCKLDTFAASPALCDLGIHYHTEDNLPVFIKDSEDAEIFLKLQDLSNPKQGFNIYLNEDCVCFTYK